MRKLSKIRSFFPSLRKTKDVKDVKDTRKCKILYKPVKGRDSTENVQEDIMAHVESFLIPDDAASLRRTKKAIGKNKIICEKFYTTSLIQAMKKGNQDNVQRILSKPLPNDMGDDGRARIIINAIFTKDGQNTKIIKGVNFNIYSLLAKKIIMDNIPLSKEETTLLFKQPYSPHPDDASLPIFLKDLFASEVQHDGDKDFIRHIISGPLPEHITEEDREYVVKARLFDGGKEDTPLRLQKKWLFGVPMTTRIVDFLQNEVMRSDIPLNDEEFNLLKKDSTTYAPMMLAQSKRSYTDKQLNSLCKIGRYPSLDREYIGASTLGVLIILANKRHKIEQKTLSELWDKGLEGMIIRTPHYELPEPHTADTIIEGQNDKLKVDLLKSGRPLTPQQEENIREGLKKSLKYLKLREENNVLSKEQTDDIMNNYIKPRAASSSPYFGNNSHEEAMGLIEKFRTPMEKINDIAEECKRVIDSGKDDDDLAKLTDEQKERVLTIYKRNYRHMNMLKKPDLSEDEVQDLMHNFFQEGAIKDATIDFLSQPSEDNFNTIDMITKALKEDVPALSQQDFENNITNESKRVDLSLQVGSGEVTLSREQKETLIKASQDDVFYGMIMINAGIV